MISMPRAALIAAVVVAAMLIACARYSSSPQSSVVAPTGVASPTNPAAAQTVIGKLGNFGVYNSIDEAEAVAGFHIPRPPADKYSLAFGQTHLRGGFGRPFSTTNYKYGPGDSDALGLDVAPITDWAAGALQRGNRKAVGGRDGWMITDSIGGEFAFHCGDTHDGIEVWCQVTAPRGLGLQGLNEFVASLS
jgi:hypothetical protein